MGLLPTGWWGRRVHIKHADKYRSQVSFEAHDAAWDAFIATSLGGHYMQASPWASLKAAYGWSSARVIVTEDEQVVAGTQVLLRPLPGGGNMGWAPRAPVLASPEPELADLMLSELHHLVRRCRVQVLMMQPPKHDEALLTALPRWGYHPTPVTVAPRATLVLPLEAGAHALLSAMRKKTRQHIHRGLRAVGVRQGDAGDLDTLYRFHLETARRKGFPAYPDGYLSRMWHSFSPYGSPRMFVAEYQGEPLAALLVLAFGETVYTLATGWSGRHAEQMPNEALYWSAIQWSEESGYRFFDFTEVDPRARAREEGCRLPEDIRKSPSFFKLGFGGEVVVFPSAHAFVKNPVLRAAFRSLVPRLYRSNRMRLALNALRWRSLTSLHATRKSAAALPRG